MRTFSKLLVLAATVAISSSLAYADMLGVGVINIGPDSAMYNSSTNSVSFVPPGSGGSDTASDGSGSLAMFNGGTVSFGSSGSITLPIATGALPSQTDWLTITEGGSTLTYDMSAITMASNNGGDINLNTNGMFSIGGADSTPGSFDFTTQGLSGQDTTFSGTGSIAPEPSSLLLFGTGLLGAAGIARRKIASKLV